MGSAGIDFNVAFESFVKWLSVTFGGGIGTRCSSAHPPRIS
ncbi:hypothetical protein RERY_00480 [Rhodococcus erythropolis]|nr:hypothetical protein RERY_00480 [Rhodococcus erythropolis]